VLDAEADRDRRPAHPLPHQAGRVIFEPFSGSGTAFVAAEKEGRRCHGMELSPAFVDVIVVRGSVTIDAETASSPSTAAC